MQAIGGEILSHPNQNTVTEGVAPFWESFGAFGELGSLLERLEEFLISWESFGRV